MIPKKIHYCWFGNPQKPKSVLKCIESWKKFCPDYEIIEWNESNIDVNINAYTKEAFDAKVWGFVTDYLRLFIVYNHGGIYLDTDVELIKPLDALLSTPAFAGFEIGNISSGLFVALGLGFGAEPRNEIVLQHMKIYDNLHFKNEDGTYNKLPAPHYTTELLKNHGLNVFDNSIQDLGDIVIYPTEYFCPKGFSSGVSYITADTFSIHHFDASWLDEETRHDVQKKRKEHKRKVKRNNLRHNITHIPHRIARFFLGTTLYERIKAKFKKE